MTKKIALLAACAAAGCFAVVAIAPSQAASANAILIVDDIVKRFETPDGVLTAVDHVSLSVTPGEFVGVIATENREQILQVPFRRRLVDRNTDGVLA